MASSSASSAAALSSLVDRTRVPDPTLQRHAVAAVFRHLLSLPAPLRGRPRRRLRDAHLAPPRRRRARRGFRRPPLRLPPRPPAPRPRPPAPPRAPRGLPLAPPRLLPSQGRLRARACALRSGSHFPPHDHPFVQALASGADGARAELVRQAARMVAEGLDGIVGFLRPLVMFSVVRKGDAAFARDLIGALAAATAAAGKAGVAISVLKLLEEGMLHFGRGDDQEMRLWLSSAEYLVDAYVMLLRKLANAHMIHYTEGFLLSTANI